MTETPAIVQPLDAMRESLFEAACKAPSDINEHLPLLRELASKCDHVTEFGTRWASGSSIAFLAAQPKTFITWDKDPHAIVSNAVNRLLELRGTTDFQPRVGDTLQIRIEPTDLLFIDTLHNGWHLRNELARHCDPADALVRKYIVFHDTATFGYVGEDGKEPGLRDAIHWFQKKFAFPLWYALHDLENNNGLVVLERVDY